MIQKLEMIKNQAKRIRKPFLVLIFLLVLDWSVLIATFSLYSVFRPDIMAITVYFSLYAYLFLTGRRNDIPFLLISSALSLLWVLIAQDQYGYEKEMMCPGGFPVYPFFSWSSGLAALYLIYSDFEQIIMKNGGWFKRFLLFSTLHIVLLIAIETIAYHVFEIRNAVTAAYSGLPICDCIHAPHWMQAAYLLLGPIYFILCRFYSLGISHSRPY
jgi:hypothetical protein